MFKTHSQNSYFSRLKTFLNQKHQNVLKTWIPPISNYVVLSMIIMRILSIFLKKCCTMNMELGRLKKKKDCPQASFECFKYVKGLFKHHQFFSIFDHWNFAINGTYSKRKFDNPNFCASLMIFQELNNTILNIIHTP